jgi:hypothetical protein
MTFWALRLALFSSLICAVVASAPDVGAAWLSQRPSTFDVEGRVLNGTAGASPPNEMELKVIAFAENDIRGTWDAAVDAEGGYRAAGIPWMDGVTYVLGADFQGVPYLAQIVPPEGPGTIATQDLTVYESVATDPGIRFDQSALIVTEVDESRRAVTVTELHTIVNPTDRTFAPQMGGPGGAAGLLVFGMPQSSFDFTPGRGLDSSQIVEIGLGFASLSPIYPGRRELSFSYRFPYSGSQATFNRTVRYPVDMVRVLVRTPGPDVRSTALAATEPANIGGQQYRILSGGPITPGAPLSFTLDNLPVPGGIFASIPPAVPAAVGALVGLAVVLLYWRRTRRQEPATVLQPASSDDVVDRLVDLDVELAAARLTDAEYQQARKALLTEHLTRLSSVEQVPGEPHEARN